MAERTKISPDIVRATEAFKKLATFGFELPEQVLIQKTDSSALPDRVTVTENNELLIASLPPKVLTTNTVAEIIREANRSGRLSLPIDATGPETYALPKVENGTDDDFSYNFNGTLLRIVTQDGSRRMLLSFESDEITRRESRNKPNAKNTANILNQLADIQNTPRAIYSRHKKLKRGTTTVEAYERSATPVAAKDMPCDKDFDIVMAENDWIRVKGAEATKAAKKFVDPGPTPQTGEDKKKVWLTVKTHEIVIYKPVHGSGVKDLILVVRKPILNISSTLVFESYIPSLYSEKTA